MCCLYVCVVCGHVNGTGSSVCPHGRIPLILCVSLFYGNNIVLVVAQELKNTVGVVDHGLFIGMSSAVIVAGSDGIYVKEP